MISVAVLPLKLLLPTYVAVTWWAPAVRLDVENVAIFGLRPFSVPAPNSVMPS